MGLRFRDEAGVRSEGGAVQLGRASPRRAGTRTGWEIARGGPGQRLPAPRWLLRPRRPEARVALGNPV